jgi:8-oxo-dGTP pyrophosphatase MutT (NUDIX family)
MKTQLAIYVSTFVLWHDRILILQRRSTEKDFANLWEIPGGRMKASENIQDACKRETFEETGLHVHLLEPVSLMEYWKETGRTQMNCVQVNFLCQLKNAREPRILLSNEHARYQWVPWNCHGNRLVSKELRKSWKEASARIGTYARLFENV